MSKKPHTTKRVACYHVSAPRLHTSSLRGSLRWKYWMPVQLPCARCNLPGIKVIEQRVGSYAINTLMLFIVVSRVAYLYRGFF